MRAIPCALLAALAAGLGGCCSLSRMFCGPDSSPWISQRFDSPRATVMTLFEALRRDDPEALFLCLSREYRRGELGIEDSMVMKLAWDRFREANPYLHVAGWTEVPEPRRLDADHATVALDVVGEPVEIDLRRAAFWEVRYQVPGGPPGDKSGALRSFAERAQISELDDRADPTSRLMVAPFEFEHGVDPVPLEAVEHVALTRRWQVTAIRRL